MRPWEQLSHDLRESNRQVADHLSVKLRAIGCERSRQLKDSVVVTEFSDGEIKSLAKMEHRRWCADRYLAGWTYGPRKNHRQKTTPMLVSWTELDDVDERAGRKAGYSKDLDRGQVVRIPKLLELVGEKIYRRIERKD
jgi:hypothetical protein